MLSQPLQTYITIIIEKNLENKNKNKNSTLNYKNVFGFSSSCHYVAKFCSFIDAYIDQVIL